MKTDLKKIPLLFSLLFLFIIAGCASPTTKQIRVDDVAAAVEAQKQREIAFEMWVENRERLNNIAYNIYTSSVPLCEDKTSFSIGIDVVNKYSFSEKMRETAVTLFDVSDAVKIIHVIEGSAAEKAGINNGDFPIEINGWIVPDGEGAAGEFMEKLKEARQDGEKISLKMLSDDMKETINITPDRICDYDIHLTNDDIVNAFADGKTVVITRGMMRFTNSDTELALVVSHELAHNVMEHINAKTQNYILGSIFDIAASVYGIDTQGMFGRMGANAYSKEFEAEADYVGLYMMALAGLDIEKAPNFWRRMAAIHPGSIESSHASTHPATPYRFVALEKTVKEIQQKIIAGEPITPDLKKDIIFDKEIDDPYDY